MCLKYIVYEINESNKLGKHDARVHIYVCNAVVFNLGVSTPGGREDLSEGSRARGQQHARLYI